MAVGSFMMYNEAQKDYFDATDSNWAVNTHYCMLLDSAYVPNAAHHTRASLDANEIADGDYAKQDMSGEAVVDNASPADGTVNCDADDVTFGNPVTISALFLAVLEGTVAGTASGDRVVGVVQLNTDSPIVVPASTNGPFTVQWSATGVFQVTSTPNPA